MSRFDIAHNYDFLLPFRSMTLCSQILVGNRKIYIPRLYYAAVWDDPVGISPRCLVLEKVE